MIKKIQKPLPFYLEFGTFLICALPLSHSYSLSSSLSIAMRSYIIKCIVLLFAALQPLELVLNFFLFFFAKQKVQQN